jgi:hypothetical protein
MQYNQKMLLKKEVKEFKIGSIDVLGNVETGSLIGLDEEGQGLVEKLKKVKTLNLLKIMLYLVN